MHGGQFVTGVLPDRLYRIHSFLVLDLRVLAVYREHEVVQRNSTFQLSAITENGLPAYLNALVCRHP
jgi:hypothetical protein